MKKLERNSISKTYFVLSVGGFVAKIGLGIRKLWADFGKQDFSHR